MGGVALAASWGGPRLPDEGQHPFQMNRNSVAPLSAQGLADVGRLIDGASTFVEEVYLPDVLMLAEHYRDWSTIGLGIGHYLSFGEYPEDGAAEPALLLPRGRIMDRDLSHIVDVAESGVAESVAHSHYVDADGGALRHPRDGRTTPKYAGPTPPVSTLAGWDRYSWVKAPRYEDDPMETGPAARVMVAAAAGSARLASAMTRVTASGASTLVRSFVLGNTLGRTVARAIEAELVAERLHGWLDELHANMASGDLAFADLTKWDPATWPREAEGWAIGETAGGATGHWLRIEDRRIASYQVVDGTTWNASPRDRRDRRGAIEEALIGTPVADPGRPLEILRVIHSFDPCMAAAVH
jgi:Ni,Fe-hydrogenase I large subunit